MKQLYAYVLKAKWNAFLVVLIAIALLFSASSFASESTLQMQMPANQMVKTHVSDQMDVHDTMRMDDHNDCCEDEEEAPCSDNGDCNLLSLNLSASCAVLATEGNLISAQNKMPTAPGNTIRDGISAFLNAPPPRT